MPAVNRNLYLTPLVCAVTPTTGPEKSRGWHQRPCSEMRAREAVEQAVT